MKKRMIWLGVVLAVTAGASVYYARNRSQPAPAIATASVTRGDIVETVDATGSLQAVTTVLVGTQVSGTIKALHADFNTRVRRGQVVAELDPSLFETQVEQARASLTRLDADARRAAVQLDDARQKLKRARELAGRQLIAASDLDTAEINARQADAAVESARAQVAQARASLHQSEVNLAHTIIRAPIDGIVISRNVDVGQTVAASMQAPTLFVIARDLRQMQVSASIAEADVAGIEAGQPVSFRVDAYPADVFAGVISQVRLQPVIEQNVVSYVTLIDVPNPDLRLKPGMTANVTVAVARAANVLQVPNSALRVRPSAELLAALGSAAAGSRAELAGGARDQLTVGTAGAAGSPGEVWVLIEGRLGRVPVRTGISDGTRTAVFSDDLREGAAVVTSISGQAEITSTSPLLPSFPGRGGAAGRGTTGGSRPVR